MFNILLERFSSSICIQTLFGMNARPEFKDYSERV